MVSKINYDARSVTVEWYERNETKGKEVELDAILQLNAELCREENEAASMPKIIKQTSSTPLSRVSIDVALAFGNSKRFFLPAKIETDSVYSCTGFTCG